MLLTSLAMATVWSVPENGPLNQVCASAEDGDEILITEDQSTSNCDSQAFNLTVRSDVEGSPRAVHSMRLVSGCIVKDLSFNGKVSQAALELYGDDCTVERVTIIDVPQHGILIEDGVHRLNDIEVSGLSNGHALWIEGSSTRNSSVVLNECFLHGNEQTPVLVSGEGKGVNLEVKDCTVSNNLAADGGGIVMQGDSTLLVTDTTFTANTADAGGAIQLDSTAAATLTNVDLLGNVAGLGSAIYSEGADLTLQSSRVVGNGPSEAVHVGLGGPVLELTNTMFCVNEGPAVFAHARVLADRVLFHNNGEPALEIGLSTDSELSNMTLIDDDARLDSQDTAISNTVFGVGTPRGDFDGDHNAFVGAGPDGTYVIDDPGFWAGFSRGDCSTLPYLRSDSPLAGSGRDGVDIGAFGVRSPYTAGPQSGGCAVSTAPWWCALLAMLAARRGSGGSARSRHRPGPKPR